MPAGRPLRFLLVVTGGWTAMRVVMLWPGELPEIAAATLATPADAAPAHITWHDGSGHHYVDNPRVTVVSRKTLWTAALTYAGRPSMPTTNVPTVFPPAASKRTPIPPGPQPPLVAGVPVVPPPHRASRWSGSAWLVARGGSGAGSGFTGPQLGGSQAGLRIAYALDEARHLAIAARLASPLGDGQRDAAIGFEWRPTRLPIRLVAEQRFTPGAGRGGPTIGVIGGFGPLPVLQGVRAEGYGQAGYIARGSGGEGFADGAVRLSHPLGDLAHIKFDLGAATWGAAQKGASRLDIGPSIGAIAKLGRQHVRLSLEWRQRVAGNATPPSGPALSLGMDF